MTVNGITTNTGSINVISSSVTWNGLSDGLAIGTVVEADKRTGAPDAALPGGILLGGMLTSAM